MFSHINIIFSCILKYLRRRMGY